MVSIALGCGQHDAVRQSRSGAGFNAYKIRHAEGLWSDKSRLKDRQKYEDPRDYWFGDTTHLTGLVTTQDHFAMEGRPLVQERRSASSASIRTLPSMPVRTHPPLLRRDPHALGSAAGLVIDLSVLYRLQNRTVVCQAENNVPGRRQRRVRKGREMHWIRIDRYYSEPVKAD